MPQAPTLTPDQIQSQAQTAQGINPANFLIAAADLHNSGQLPTAPAGPGFPSPGSRKRQPRKLKVLK